MCRQRGFTLLEMLVVMVLMGLVTTLALPAMQRWHDAVQARAQAASLVDALRAASFKAGASRRDILVDEASFSVAPPVTPTPTAAPGASAVRPEPSSARDSSTFAKATAATREVDVAVAEGTSDRLPLELPPRWRTEKVADIRFLANGLCKPGAIRLRTERGEAVSIEVRGPLCGVELAPVGATATP